MTNLWEDADELLRTVDSFVRVHLRETLSAKSNKPKTIIHDFEMSGMLLAIMTRLSFWDEC